MSEVETLDLSEAEVAVRLDNMRAAIASARIEGAEVSAGSRAVMELYNRGHINADEMIRRIHVLHAGG